MRRLLLGIYSDFNGLTRFDMMYTELAAVSAIQVGLLIFCGDIGSHLAKQGR
jgi:hypothetical protein